MPNEIVSEIKGQALIVTFNRPDRGNAFNVDMANQFFTLMKTTTTNNAVRAVLLRGKGGNFMRGLDMLSYTGDVGLGVERINQMMQPYNSTIREMQAMEKPILAAVEGDVQGPGMSFMLASDLVMASRSAKLNCSFSSYGMSPDGGASFYLARKAGSLRASQLLMLSETISAEEAQKYNLVTTVVDDDKFEAESLRMVERLATMPTRAMGSAKTLISKAFDQGLQPQLALEHAYWGQCSRSFDFREAIRALVTKRDPKFMGS